MPMSQFLKTGKAGVAACRGDGTALAISKTLHPRRRSELAARITPTDAEEATTIMGRA